MKQNRTQLEWDVSLLLNKLLNKGLKQDLINTFTEELDKYVNRGKLVRLITLNLPISSASVSELYHICRVAKKHYKLEFVAEDYFTDTEMTEATNDILLSFDGWLKLDDVLYNHNDSKPEWTCIVSYKELYQYFSVGALSYNMQTQRAGKMIKSGGDIVIVPNINAESRLQIKKEILAGTFSTNMITLNITKSNMESNNVLYDEIEKTLSINVNNIECAIIDGMHRTLGCVDAYEENGDIKGYFVLQIKNLTIQQARNFIVQESKANKHDINAITLMDNTNPLTMFINDLNTYANRENNIFYQNIIIGMNKREGIIYDSTVQSGLMMSGWVDIVSKKDLIETDKALKFIVKFFTVFYKLDNNEHEIYKDESFMLGLFATAYTLYQKSEYLDLSDISNLLKKLNKKDIKEYTFDFPVKNLREGKSILKKFKDLV